MLTAMGMGPLAAYAPAFLGEPAALAAAAARAAAAFAPKQPVSAASATKAATKPTARMGMVVYSISCVCRDSACAHTPGRHQLSCLCSHVGCMHGLCRKSRQIAMDTQHSVLP